MLVTKTKGLNTCFSVYYYKNGDKIFITRDKERQRI